jgi:predicted GNAT family N-acyltransferase
LSNQANADAVLDRVEDRALRRRVSGAPDTGLARPKTVEKAFEPGTYTADGGFVFVCHPSPDMLAASYHLLLAELGTEVAPFSVVRSVYAHNPLSWWLICRAADESRADAQSAGFCAYLPLNAQGFAALKRGAINARDPDLHLLAPEGEDPVALYLWAIVAHGLSDIGGKLIGHAIGLDLYESLPMFGTIGTEAGLAALRRSSKSAVDAAALKIGSPFEIKLPQKHVEHQRGLRVWEGVRRTPLENRQPAQRMAHPRLEARVASTADDIAKIFALRAAVFMAEQECPYEEEFDGNDYSGTHILGLVNGAPAATLRIRYFADFVKIERLAVLPRSRRTLIAREVVEHGIALVRRKGYTQMYGQSQKRLVGFWRKFGFEPMTKNAALVFSDHEYVEIAGALAPHAERLTMQSDPYALIRPEGRWDELGVLDRSAGRKSTNPCRVNITASARRKPVAEATQP